MLKVRSDEPQYAFLWDKETKQHNCYGDAIEKTSPDDVLRGQSLTINGDTEVGENPNRYKQHGFYFNADNCIGCHACEAACSEKNDNPAHIAFRSVGFVEGGSYPAYQRLNISMACNHCDDPVCLKGCPTRAYTKFAEYGAVLQDPDICFGCGYCTWVCPYNAPQLDPVKGQVSKCNMCVDRLEVGLKPSCVAACLGNALDFGVVENMPENRSQAKTSIPGFPDSEITHPNIRFQQTKDTQRDMVRTDGVAVKYHKQANGQFKSVLDNKKHTSDKKWGLATLWHSHENAHAIFTLCAQIVMGGALWLLASDYTQAVTKLPVLHYVSVLVVMIVLLAYGLFTLNMHLGKPQFFYRGFYNLRLSPVSREIAGVSLFFIGLLLLGAAKLIAVSWLVALASVITFFGFVLGSYYMYKLYRIPARPYWDHWQTASAFYGTMLSLGSVVFFVLSSVITQSVIFPWLVAMVVLTGLVLESIGHMAHSKAVQATGEGQAAYFEQVSTFGKTYYLRNSLLVINMLLVTAMLFFPSVWLLSLLLLSLSISAYLGRILFYAVVIPTTMPGAFFWKNKQFSEHAVKVGLSEMPQVGVEKEHHHRFDMAALFVVIKETSWKAVGKQIKAIVQG